MVPTIKRCSHRSYSLQDLGRSLSTNRLCFQGRSGETQAKPPPVAKGTPKYHLVTFCGRKVFCQYQKTQRSAIRSGTSRCKPNKTHKFMARSVLRGNLFVAGLLFFGLNLKANHFCVGCVSHEQNKSIGHIVKG